MCSDLAGGSIEVWRMLALDKLLPCQLPLSASKKAMSYRPNSRVEELREELRTLMGEHLESVKAQTFCGLNEEELRKQDESLNRIREVAADFLFALKDEACDSGKN